MKFDPGSEYTRDAVETRETAGADALNMMDPELLGEYVAAHSRLISRLIREARNVGDIFRNHRRIVILGGPGSGKTTIARWLALQMSRGLLRQKETGAPQCVMVPISQINPDSSAHRAPEEQIDLGPARFPIYLRLGHFARELAEREREQQATPSLIEYLGRDPDSASAGDDCTADSRNALFRSYLQCDQAVVILDGLDEVPDANRRSVVLRITAFIEMTTRAIDLNDDASPWKVGGNQVVVTSRYAGYTLAPVRAGSAHFCIQSMQRPAVERFARSWATAVNAELPTESFEQVVAGNLIAELDNEAWPAVRELATNPLLVTILATIEWREGGLPGQRAGVYDRVVENLLRIWLDREECKAHNLTRDELLAALEPLAAEMQESTINGLIGLDRIGELVEGPLAQMRGISPSDRRFRPLRDALLRTIRTHVGLLAEQSAGNYAFFHRTFQEFLAARHLLADRQMAAYKLSERLDDPRWREPLLLALEFAMTDREWGPEARSRLLGDVLAAEGSDALIPRVALLLVTALPDLRIAPAGVVTQIVVRLAFIASELFEALLRDAVESIAGINNPIRRAETICQVRAVWGRNVGVSEALDAVARTIPDPWQRDKALGRASRLVQAYRTQYSIAALAWRFPPDAASPGRVCRQLYPTGTLPWGLLYLNVLASEVETLDTASSGDAAHWDRLLGSERQAGIAALVAAGAEEGIQVTAREASILDRVVHSDYAADLDGLWPFLERPDPAALATVTRWQARPDEAGRWSALVQAEGGRLTPETVTTVIDLLADSSDRLHLRAALALHGRSPHARNTERRWCVRRIGAEAVEVLARRATQFDCSPAVRSSLQRVRCDIHHDDPEALNRWLTQAAAAESTLAPAYWVLDSLESIQEDLVPSLFEALKAGPPRLQRALLRSLARIAYCSKALERSSKALLSAVAAVPRAVRVSMGVPPEGPVTFLEVASGAVKASRGGDRLDQARQMIERQILWVDEACLSNGSCLQRLKAMGEQLYISPDYWAKTDKAAAPLAENAAALQLLLGWLESEGVTGSADRATDHHLLTAIAAVARLSPVAFAAVADPDIWGPTLTEWVQVGEHWISRLAAVRLLGHLRRLTDQVVVALKAAMNDISFVQQAASESVPEFRRIEGDVLSALLTLLDDRSAGVAAATAQLLVGVARAAVASADRRRIRSALQEAATRHSMIRPVYRMDEGELMRIRFVDRLDRIIYRAVFEVSGF